MMSSNRLRFTQADGEYLISLIKKFDQMGRRLRLHPIMSGSVQEAFEEGVIALRAEDLDADFLFVKQNAGRGFFGGQKSRVMTYVGTISEDELMPSTLVRNLPMAFVAVSAVYRSQGY